MSPGQYLFYGAEESRYHATHFVANMPSNSSTQMSGITPSFAMPPHDVARTQRYATCRNGIAAACDRAMLIALAAAFINTSGSRRA